MLEDARLKKGCLITKSHWIICRSHDCFYSNFLPKSFVVCDLDKIIVPMKFIGYGILFILEAYKKIFANNMQLLTNLNLGSCNITRNSLTLQVNEHENIVDIISFYIQSISSCDFMHPCIRISKVLD